MSETHDTKTAESLNDQGAPVEGRILLSAPIDRVIPDPERPNIRGRVVDTTDLQPSIKEHGIQNPIQVRIAPDKPGYFYRIAGARRQIAARAVGLTEVPVIVVEGADEREIRRLMLISDLHKSEPHIVINKDGEVVAGKCRAVYEEIEENGSTRQELAAAMGVSPDIIGAYYCLYTDLPEIQEKVAKGQMAITVYSLIKHHGPEVKMRLAEKRGKVSARYVRDTLKGWKPGEEPYEKTTVILPGSIAQIDGDDLNINLPSKQSTEDSKTIKISLKRKMTVPQLLVNALDSVKKIESGMAPTDWHILESIEAECQRIREANA